MYRYGSIEVEPQEYPPWMIELLKKSMNFCGITNPDEWPNSCNLNLYEDGGMSVGWHSDDESLFQGKFRDILIISLSLGVKRRFELRMNWPGEDEKPARRMYLGDGDYMTMEGMVQKHYMHRVPKEDNIEGPRINLTWRWIVRHKPRCPATRARNHRFSDQSHLVGSSGMPLNQAGCGHWRPMAPSHDGANPAKRWTPTTVPPPNGPKAVPPPPPPSGGKAPAPLQPGVVEPSQPGSEDRGDDRNPSEQMTTPKSSLWPPLRPNLLRQVSSPMDATAIEAPQSKLGPAAKPPMVVPPRPRP